MSKSKPPKPYPDFPLTPHDNGSWCKRIHRRLFYFGRWDDWQEALQEYLDQRDDLYAGRSPTRRKNAQTLGFALDHFLSSKKLAQESGEISERMYGEHERTCDRIVNSLGKNRLLSEIDVPSLEKLRSDLSKGYSKNGDRETKAHLAPATVKGELTRARMVFLYLNENLADKPIVYRKPLRSPSRRLLRQAVNERGPCDLGRAEIVSLLDLASPQVKAMI